jgi:dethiobiotin synthetase
MTAIFITGTDTDCGKTYVTCQLLNYFKKEQFNPLALKPVASGCYESQGEWLSEDVLNLQKFNSVASYSINNWKFLPPVSPHIAAKSKGIRLSAAELLKFCAQEHFSQFAPLFVEGAGGLMVPLNEQETWIDFLALSQIPVLVVVGMKLGCINHALLTDTVIKEKKIASLGWIANCLDKNMLALEENISTLSAMMQIPLLAVLEHQGEFSKNSNLENGLKSCL